MDLREQKTLKSIRNAFLSLRSKKPLEKISVKDLAALAEISKATFYLHYRDIYDLSEQLQDEVIRGVLASLGSPDLFLTDTLRFTEELFHAFVAQQTIIEILFSGSQSVALPIRIESAIRDHIFNVLPERRDDASFNIMLTYRIYGGYYAFIKNQRRFGTDTLIETVAGLSQN